MLRRHFMINTESSIPDTPDIPNDEIWYTSSDGNIVTPYDTAVLPPIVSNTYVDGKGVIKFETDVINIGYRAFYKCSSLTYIIIPNSVTSIGEEAFYMCPLTSITIPNNLTFIGEWAFRGCSLTYVHITDLAAWCNINFEDYDANPLYHAHKLYINGKLVKDLVIPNNVTSIRNYAFWNCSSLRSVTIPNSVTSIGICAFRDCNKLTSITIPNSVTSIGGRAFDGCSSLTSVTIPNSVTSIENYTFYECSSLISITIPDSITSIGEEVFLGCYSLTSVTIPESVTSIGTNAFGKISAKLLFSKLYPTYTNKIFFAPPPTIATSIIYNVEFNISEIPTDYNISSMLPNNSSKATITYNIYTDYIPCKDQALALVNTKTIVNVYHIDGTSWT